MKILRIGGVFGGFLSLVLSMSAQTLTTLHSFDGVDGINPDAGLVQATDGNFYSSTNGGGLSNRHCGGYGCGTVYKITPGGKLTRIYSFCSLTDCSNGAFPLGGLVQATNGDLYGTTEVGTVFKITAGELTTLHFFDGTDGSNPYAG